MFQVVGFRLLRECGLQVYQARGHTQNSNNNETLIAEVTEVMVDVGHDSQMSRDPMGGARVVETQYSCIVILRESVSHCRSFDLNC